VSEVIDILDHFLSPISADMVVYCCRETGFFNLILSCNRQFSADREFPRCCIVFIGPFTITKGSVLTQLIHFQMFKEHI